VIETRAFACPGDETYDSGDSWCLVPYVDLLSHQSYLDSNYGVNLVQDGMFDVASHEAYEPGAEVAISYGSHHSSTHFLQTYGFMPIGFEGADKVSLEFTPKIAPGNKHRLATYFAVVGIDGCLLPESFLDSLASDIFSNPKLLPPMFTPKRTPPKETIRQILSNTTEITAAQRRLLKMVQSEQAHFAESYEKDVKALHAGFTTYEEWVILSVRSRYKRILRALVASLEQSISTGKTCTPQSWHHTVDDARVLRHKRGHNTSTDSIFHIVVK